MTGYAFQTRARTIDHLGRGQIADSPTAVSELWKNAYDAYARNVSLHLFEGDSANQQPEVAAIFDDGSGMDIEDVLDRWLVIGTESKVDETTAKPRETFGLRYRPRQGEKGIGRLSAAFLAPATILVSKRPEGKFVAIAVDWRLFENPFVSLSDVQLPVVESESASDCIDRLRQSLSILTDNLGIWKADDQAVPTERQSRLNVAWKKYAERFGDGAREELSKDISLLWDVIPIASQHLEEWPVYSGIGDHGTALFMIRIHRELSVWVGDGHDASDTTEVKERLRETLTAFTDPFVPEGGTSTGNVDRRLPLEAQGLVRDAQFDYEVIVKRGGRNHRILSRGDRFGYDDFLTLEHRIEGSFSSDGSFSGTLTAFGKDFGEVYFDRPRDVSVSATQKVGPIAFCIGTFEQEALSSSHLDARHADLAQDADKHGGISLYRDGLRVMPYGRHDADFFSIEERRSKHAGREFWSHRRSFGRVAFSREANPELRDKAGREGLVDNYAKRTLRTLVMSLLMRAARTYFGTKSAPREELLPGIQAGKVAAREAADRIRTSRKRNVRSFLKNHIPELREAVQRADKLAGYISIAAAEEDFAKLDAIGAEFAELKDMRDRLRPPPVPSKLGDLEEKYRGYRDDFRMLVASIDLLTREVNKAETELGSTNADEALKSRFSRNQAILSARVGHYLDRADNHINSIRSGLRSQATEDRGAYYAFARPFLETTSTRDQLSHGLNVLDVEQQRLLEQFADAYEPKIRALEQIAEGADLEGALSVMTDDALDLGSKLNELNAVAQVGITVEIIGHELEFLDSSVRRNLMRLPEEIRKSPAFKLAFEAHSALTEKLRFLSPLKVAGYRGRERINGRRISKYVRDFFAGVFESYRIEFRSTDSFDQLAINDLESRIFPVFINLVNNSVHWVQQSAERRITLDLVGDAVIVADSGPGVDPDDVPYLFDLFYTRRRGGRGVGLYLCRSNLGVANHQIRYAEPGDPTADVGANFIILFKGLSRNV